MTRRRKTVKQLAQEAQLDEDEALIALWDAGFNDIINLVDRPKDVNRARRALGVATRRELKEIAYWMSIFDLLEEDFRDLLQKLSVPIREDTQKLSTKAISRLQSEARKRGIDPLTGILSEPVPQFRESLPLISKWQTLGHRQELRWLNEDEVLAIHFELVKDFSTYDDPITPPGPRDIGLLGSAVFRPQTALGGTLKYPTVEMSAAALLHSIIHDHPFHNGNKRTALVSVLVFLDENGFFPEFNANEAFKLVLDIAQHRIADSDSQNLPDREVLAIAEWLCQHCRIFERGDRPIPFRKLRQKLVDYGCELEFSSRGKVSITRSITERFLRVITKRKLLHIQIPYHGEGNDVSTTTIKRIRRALQLDDVHGIDSRAFYGKDPIIITEFINHYRNTLRRLAKF
jgi:death-on-curing family protein